MEIPVILYTKSPKGVILNLFEGNKFKDILLDRAKISFKNQNFQFEQNDGKVEILISLLTPFGAASASKYLCDKLQKDSISLIQIGETKLTVFNDVIRESILKQYSELHS